MYFRWSTASLGVKVFWHDVVRGCLLLLDVAGGGYERSDLVLDDHKWDHDRVTVDDNSAEKNLF